MKKEIEFEESCGNVFEDLGLPNAKELLEESKRLIELERSIDPIDFESAD